MALFAITYDLNARKDYQSLWDEMKRLHAHKAARSFYFANLDDTATTVRDHFAQFVDEDDTLVVVEFSKHPKCKKALKGTNDWITENVG